MASVPQVFQALRHQLRSWMRAAQSPTMVVPPRADLPAVPTDHDVVSSIKNMEGKWLGHAISESDSGGLSIIRD
jgi:hypothetical protein